MPSFQQLMAQGAEAQDSGHTEAAVKAYNAAISNAMEAGDGEGLAQAQHMLGVTYKIAGDLKQAIYELEQTAEYYRHVIDHAGRGQVSRDLGVCYAHRHDNTLAVQWLLRSVHELQQTNEPAELGLSEAKLGLLYLSTSEAKKAEAWITHGLAAIRSANNWLYEVTALIHCGQLYLRTNRPQEAATVIWAAIGLLAENDVPGSHLRRRAQLYGLLGRLYQRLGDSASSERFSKRAASLLADLPDAVADIVREAFSESAVAPLAADLLEPAPAAAPPDDPNLAGGPWLD